MHIDDHNISDTETHNQLERLCHGLPGRCGRVMSLNVLLTVVT